MTALDSEKSESPFVGNNIKHAQSLDLTNGIIRYAVTLWRYKAAIFIPVAMTAAASVVFALISIRLPANASPMPNYYRAETIVLVGNPAGLRSPGMLTAFNSLELSDVVDSNNVNQNYQGTLALEILRSPIILDKITSEFDIPARYKIVDNVRTRSRKIVLDKADFSFDKLTGLLKIAYTDIEPEIAQKLSIRTAVLLSEWFANSINLERTRELEYISKKIKDLSEEIALLLAELSDFQKKYGVVSTQDTAQTRESLLSDLRRQLVNKEMELKNYQGFTTIDDQTIQRLKAERNSIRNVIDQIGRGDTSVYGGYVAKDGSSTNLSLVYAELDTQLQIRRSLYQFLTQKYETAKIEQQRTKLFDIIHQAQVPDQKAGPKRSMMVIRNTLAVLALAVVIVLEYDAVKRKLGARNAVP